jgi:hypothetical protein
MHKDNASRIEWVADDRVGKSFIVMSTNGDLPSNPMCLGECVICGGVFTQPESMAHLEALCLPSLEQPFAMVARRG